MNIILFFLFFACLKNSQGKVVLIFKAVLISFRNRIFFVGAGVGLSFFFLFPITKVYTLL